MRGVIKNFLESKGYGFIAGEDGKDYFFHINEVKNRSKQILDGLPVRFEESLSPKGYNAKQISLLDDNLLYEQPQNVLTSKGNEVKGWSIVEKGSHSLRYYSSNSPDEARDGLKLLAQSLGITGLINLRYYKTTGSSGNYNYTVHNFEGTPVSLVKKGLAGKLHIESVPRFHDKLEEYIQHLAEENAFQQRLKYFRRKIFLAVIGVCVCICAILPKVTFVFFGVIVVSAMCIWKSPFFEQKLREIESRKALQTEVVD